MSPGAPTFPARHHADAARPRPAVPHRPGWIYEEKVDGWRMLALKDRGRVRLVSRQGVDHTARSVDLAVAVTRLPA
jgi:bifunctional non-homologous end joining protein LigD